MSGNENATESFHRSSALMTDLYQLTMMDCYYRLGMERPAVFEFFVRRLPDRRNFLIACGLEQILDYLEHLRFAPSEIQWLRDTGRFDASFLERLADFRFTGEVFAMREGSVFFASEPVLSVIAPLPQAQLIESRLVNLLHYQTLIASKAARCRLAAADAELVDFGMRRAHGSEAACLASRAAYIAGFDATAMLAASRRYGIPAAGTMAHSYVLAHETEELAFRNFAACRPADLVLLIDTYDIARGASRAAKLAKTLRENGSRLEAVRIDSGDLGMEAKRVRAILDREGCHDTRIMVSGNVDEESIAQMRRAQAPIDIYGVGTRLTVSEDAPALDCAYKLQQYAGRPCRKRSQWKETWPGQRQVYRQYDLHGYLCLDMLGCVDETREGRALLRRVMSNGRRTVVSPRLSEIRKYCAHELALLPPTLRTLETVTMPMVKVSSRQHALAAEVDLIRH